MLFSYECFRLWKFRRLEAISAFNLKMGKEVRLKKRKQQKATMSKLHFTQRPPKDKNKDRPKLPSLLAIWALELQIVLS